MNRLRRCLLIGLVACMVVGVGEKVTYAEEQELSLAENAKSAILIERDTGEILYDKKMDEQLPPASMTKIMTLLLVMDAIEREQLSYDEKITVSEKASSMGGSQVFLEAGEEMSVNDLIKAVSVASANDASVALAERIAGSESAFVQQMNQKAKSLHLTDTHFQNTSGLPAKNHYSSAHDMAVIAKELLKYEQITKYTSIYEDYLRQGKENEFWLVNTNKLVRTHDYVDGLKTGHTNEAKFCLTATAKKEDMRLIAVVMGAENVKERNAMTMELIDYGFSHYEVEKLFDKNEEVATFDMLQSEKYRYPVKTSEQISILHKKGETKKAPTTTISMHQPTALPLDKGMPIGEMAITTGKEEITSPLVLDEQLKPATYFTLWKRSLKYLMKKGD